ncbi:MAG: 6-pyruvoyl trahydropterin synthase family protein [Candidatus Cyclobacteriaceae bacterium M2_1C_046]
MNLVRITKEFNFEMAHSLFEYDGKCSNIHGHSYELKVTLKGRPSTQKDNSPLGMVMDFKDLKEIVKREIIEPFDHMLVLKKNDTRFPELPESTRVIRVAYQPTCENLLIDFATRLKKHFDGNPQLYSMQLRETATCYAEWYADENE